MVTKVTAGKLAAAADIAITNALTKSTYPFVAAPKTEPDYIAALIIFGVQDIATSWTPILARSGLSVQISGVFCHQSQKVKFTGTGATSAVSRSTHRCELADLLVVYDHLAGGSIKSRRAMLIQAKTTKTGRVKTPDAVQYDLYAYWPGFEIVTGGFARGQRDFLVGGMPRQYAWTGGQYGLITIGALSPTINLADPDVPPLSAAGSPSLGDAMSGMLLTQNPTGRGVSMTNTNDWDNTIDELLNITYHRQFKAKNVLGAGKTHQAGASQIVYIVEPGGACLGLFGHGDTRGFLRVDADGRLAQLGSYDRRSSGVSFQSFDAPANPLTVQLHLDESNSYGESDEPPDSSDQDPPPDEGAGVSLIHITTDKQG